MVGVKNIKIQMYGGLIGAAVVFMAASLLFDTAKKYTRSGYYYWSRDVRDVVSIMNGIGVFLLLIGVGLLGAGIVAMILKKSGKFCPDCEKVFFRTAVMCPRCKTDLRYAKSVKMYLSERPRIMPKGTIETNNRQQISRSYSRTNRFCAHCGKELVAEVIFCPYCGNKAN